MLLRLALLLLLSLPAWATNGYLAVVGLPSEGTNWFGSTVVYRGYNAWWEFRPHWTVSVVPNAGTDLFDSAASGYTFTGSEAISGYPAGTVFISSTGALPTGLFAMRGSFWATYGVCNISGTTFALRKRWSSTVDTNGTAVTYNISGQPDFTSNLVTGAAVNINGTSATVATITDATHFTVSSSLGTHSGYSFDSGCAGTKMLFSDAGSGEIRVSFDPATPTAYITSVSGLPMGTTVSWFQTEAGGILGPLPSATKPYFFNGLGVGTMQAAIPGGATTGTYTVSITLCTVADGSGTCGTSSYDIDVRALTPVTHSPPSSALPIPTLSTWASVMTADSILSGSGGAHWCNNSTGVPNPNPLAFGDESEIWYYDGGRVYYQIATYTGNTAWNLCGANINGQYKDWIVSNGGVFQGYRVFPAGLGITWQRTGNAAYSGAVDLIANTPASAATYGGRLWDYRIRELAYAVDTYYVQEAVLGESRNANLTRSCEFLMSALNAHSLGGPHAVWQPFYGGLANEALIHCFDLTADPRIPVAIKTSLDWQWGFYNAGLHIMPYDVYNTNTPWCYDSVSGNLWFLDFGEVETTSCLDTNTDVVLRKLNNLEAPAWAWMWQYTGTPAYQVNGDELFSQAYNGSAPFSGKEFSQNYRWSFDYVRWRSTVSTVSGSRISGHANISGSVIIH